MSIEIRNLPTRINPPDKETLLGSTEEGDEQSYKVTLASLSHSVRNVTLNESSFTYAVGTIVANPQNSYTRVLSNSNDYLTLRVGNSLDISGIREVVSEKLGSLTIKVNKLGGYAESAFQYKESYLHTINTDGSLRDSWTSDEFFIRSSLYVSNGSYDDLISIRAEEDLYVEGKINQNIISYNGLLGGSFEFQTEKVVCTAELKVNTIEGDATIMHITAESILLSEGSFIEVTGDIRPFPFEEPGPQILEFDCLTGQEIILEANSVTLFDKVTIKGDMYLEGAPNDPGQTHNSLNIPYVSVQPPYGVTGDGLYPSVGSIPYMHNINPSASQTGSFGTNYFPGNSYVWIKNKNTFTSFGPGSSWQDLLLGIVGKGTSTHEVNGTIQVNIGTFPTYVTVKKSGTYFMRAVGLFSDSFTTGNDKYVILAIVKGSEVPVEETIFIKSYRSWLTTNPMVGAFVAEVVSYIEVVNEAVGVEVRPVIKSFQGSSYVVNNRSFEMIKIR